MKLISWTLAGPGTAPIIGDALRSVAGLVEFCLMIWTGPDGTPAEWARHPLPATIEARHWPWRDDFAAARNAALDFAAEAVDAHGVATRNDIARLSQQDGFGLESTPWACMVDTDERIVCPNPAAVRAFLAALPAAVQVVVAYASDLATARERFFRLPARSRWHGRTHEAFPSAPGEQVVIPPGLIMWGDVPKDAAKLRAKNERDLRLLALEIEEHPDDARWRFYLGAALAGVERLEEAIDAYREAADRDHGETGALSCMRAAELLVHAKRYEEAVACCARGLTMRADLPELSWIAAGASWNMGQPNQARAFALLAKVHGERGPGRDALRAQWTGFCNPRARREGPDEILRLVDPPPVLVPSAEPIGLTVTSSAIRAASWVSRCVDSVNEQTVLAPHVYVCADDSTWNASISHAVAAQIIDGRGRGLLENLLPIWRSLPDDEVIVWLDGDDWLATDHALATVAEMHAAGAWTTYGQYIDSAGRVGICAPVGRDPRTAPWTSSHLKTFRAGLVKRIRDEDLRWLDGEYLTLAIDQAIMIPVLEMAAERAVFCDRILCVYNDRHSFAATASAEDKAREDAAVQLVRGRARYGRHAAW